MVVSFDSTARALAAKIFKNTATTESALCEKKLTAVIRVKLF